MLAVFDAGNSRTKFALYKGDIPVFHANLEGGARAVNGLLCLRTMLDKSGYSSGEISGAAVCSVVSGMDQAIGSFCREHFEVDAFIVRPPRLAVFKHKYSDIEKLGADRAAAVFAAISKYPGQSLLIAHFGTATVIDAADKDGVFLGGAIAPGPGASMEALKLSLPDLPEVEISKTSRVCGKDTRECLTSGFFYGTLGAVKEIMERLSAECFDGRMPIVLACGGFSSIFKEEPLFEAVIPDLTIEGTRLLYAKRGGN